LKSQTQSVEGSWGDHATEEGVRGGRADVALVGVDIEPESQVAEGHFGNPIAVAKMHLTGDQALVAVKSIFSKMSPQVRDSLRRDLDKYMDEHSALYLRLDKQKLLLGEVALSESDPARVRIKPRLYALEGSAAQLYRRLLD